MNTSPFQKGAVVVTGASSGIGRACALMLDRQGFRVFAGVRKEEAAQSLKAFASERLVPTSSMLQILNPLTGPSVWCPTWSAQLA